MDDILKTVGNMPEGFRMTMPELKPVDLLAASTGQFQSIGIMVLIAAYIGAFSRERQNGTATLLYVRPVSFAALFFSKWIVASMVAVFSAVAGYVGSMYYTALLYGMVEWSKLLAMIVTYSMWLLFVMAVMVAMSAAFQTSIAATITIIALPIGLFIDALIGTYWKYTPWKLAGYEVALLTDQVLMETYAATLGLVGLLTVAILLFGIFMSKRNMGNVKI